MIVDAEGNSLLKATDCAHISPLFHAKSLVITKLGFKNTKQLTLITTMEPDPLSISSIYWSNIVQKLGIETIYYGSTFETLQNLWPFGINLKAEEILERASLLKIALNGPICEKECNKLFHEAKDIQKQIDDKHPGMLKLSQDVEDFYEIT